MIGIIIQARLNSSRLPGKILKDIQGKPMLRYLIESLEHCQCPDKLIVATSNEITDDPVAEFCNGLNVTCYRGSLDNVAGRFMGVIDVYGLDSFVRISGDSPLMDFRLVDKSIRIYQSAQYDIVTNVLKRTFPRGQSVEVINSSVFKKTYLSISSAYDREHVTPFFYEHSDEFSIHNFEANNESGHIQLSVDTPEDMLHLESILSSMKRPHWEYSFEEIIEIISKIDIH